MPATLVSVSSWHRSYIHSYMVVISPIFVFINSCYSLMGGAVKWLIAWGVMAPWEIMLFSWVSNLQIHNAMMDLTICQWIPHSMISSFVVVPCGFYSKVYSKGLSLSWLCDLRSFH
jgi:hypothetical protein